MIWGMKMCVKVLPSLSKVKTSSAQPITFPEKFDGGPQ